MEKKEKLIKVGEDTRKSLQEKRGKRTKERLTKSDLIVVEAIILGRKKRKDGDYDGKDVNYQMEREKLIEVFNQCEQRYSYETWESRKVWRTCMRDPDGYRVKANQVGRRDWSKGRLDGFESDLRNYEVNLPRYHERYQGTEEEKALMSKQSDQSRLPNEVNEESQEWGFWKYYRETDAQRVVVWKKGILHKKSIRKNEITSWDRGSFRSVEFEWYERRRRRNLRRRYVRNGQVLAPWNQPSEMGEASGKKGGGMVQEVRIKTQRDRNEKRRKENRQRAIKRKRTYNQFQNPEERKKEIDVDIMKNSPRESFFQSMLRSQTSVGRKRSNERTKPLGLDLKKVWRTSNGERKKRSTGKQRGLKKVYVWTSQLARFRYGQITRNLDRRSKKREEEKFASNNQEK